MKFAAVIVTYNRLALLKEVIESLEMQTRKPDYLIIVDNACNDGSETFLKNWKEKNVNSINKILIRSDVNLGGSGGFYLGTQKATELDVDWVWVSDDDAIPNLDVFSLAERHINVCSYLKDISAICSSVYVGGNICTSNRNKRVMKLFHMELIEIEQSEYKKEFFYCDNFSYVGVFIKNRALKSSGLINKDYFIWRDDVEHSWRISESGKIICYPDMKVNHKVNAVDYNGVSWKTYYGYRNDIIMFLSHKKYIYVFTKILSALVRCFKSRSTSERKLFYSAILNGLRKEKGLNNIYLPGKKV